MTKKKAIAFYGSQQEIARVLKVSKAAVSRWGDKIPPVHAYRLEKISEGQLVVDDPFFH